MEYVVDIERMKKAKKEKKLSFDDLAELTGYSRRAIIGIFNEETKRPRIDTVHALEVVLGISSKPKEETKELVLLIEQLTEEEVKELSSFVDYIISKRK